MNCKYDHVIQAKKENSLYIERGYTKGSSSKEEHIENALAMGADEGRDKLR